LIVLSPAIKTGGKIMILRQFLHKDPVGISYLFGCGGCAIGAVVDPMGDLQAYLHAAKDAGLRLHYVIDTHVHADHFSVGRELARAAEAEYVLFDGADVAFSFKRVGDRDVLPSVMSWQLSGTRRAIRPSISVYWSAIAPAPKSPGSFLPAIRS
jgi:glyoxylase-like metal-dependent hydrolase (beta-lactamase superfamily II)